MKNCKRDPIPTLDLKLITSIPIQKCKRRRKPKGKWTVEVKQQLKAVHGLDADIELMLDMSKSIREGIDKQIIDDLKLRSIQNGQLFRSN